MACLFKKSRPDAEPWGLKGFKLDKMGLPENLEDILEMGIVEIGDLVRLGNGELRQRVISPTDNLECWRMI